MRLTQKSFFQSTTTSVRLSYKNTYNGTIFNPDVAVVGAHDYYPFGLEHKGYNETPNSDEYPFKYNGKELEDALGLDWYDYGARWYDAAIGRWWSFDPMAKKYPSWSPYGYALDNPIKFVDPTGMLPIDIIIRDKNGAEIAVIKSKKLWGHIDLNISMGAMPLRSTYFGYQKMLDDMVPGNVDAMGIAIGGNVTAGIGVSSSIEYIQIEGNSKINKYKSKGVTLGLEAGADIQLNFYEADGKHLNKYSFVGTSFNVSLSIGEKGGGIGVNQIYSHDYEGIGFSINLGEGLPVGFGVERSTLKGKEINIGKYIGGRILNIKTQDVIFNLPKEF